jgi:hypothetical protein
LIARCAFLPFAYSARAPIPAQPQSAQQCLAVFRRLEERCVKLITTKTRENPRLSSNRGPTSASCTSLGEVFTKTWCLNNDSRQHLPLQKKKNSRRNEIKSFSFENVMTRLLSSLGTGNRYFKQSLTLSPSLELKFSKIKWGYCSETVEDRYDSMSWRRVTLWSVK